MPAHVTDRVRCTRLTSLPTRRHDRHGHREFAAACADPELRREVESLLAADEEAAGFLELTAPPSHATGTGTDDGRIGPYRLVRLLGEGEASTVHLAVRDDDAYHQRVAIKLIRPGMDSRQILQRFRQEQIGRASCRERV